MEGKVSSTTSFGSVKGIKEHELGGYVAWPIGPGKVIKVGALYKDYTLDFDPEM